MRDAALGEGPQFGFEVERWRRRRTVGHQENIFRSRTLPLFSTSPAHYLQLIKELQLHELATRVPDTGVQKDVLEPRFPLALGCYKCYKWRD